MIKLSTSAVILAGGFSKRFGRDKGLVELMGKPLIKHTLDKVNSITKDIVIVVSTDKQYENYSKNITKDASIVMDVRNEGSPLIGTLTGLIETTGEYVVLLPCDTPLISETFLHLLLDLIPGKSAVIPRWPNGYIEPLQSIYHRKEALFTAEKVLKEGKLKMRSMISELSNVLYLSTLIIKKIDPELHTFLNVNNPQDLKNAESFLRRQKNNGKND
jgi:molybdopterin-guanine dinucleotide biosynthesis protein A